MDPPVPAVHDLPLERGLLRGSARVSLVADVARTALRELDHEWAREEQREVELTQAERYARDPWLLCDEGRVMIRSKFTGRATRFHPYETQIADTAAWIDMDELRDTGRLVWRNAHKEKRRGQPPRDQVDGREAARLSLPGAVSRRPTTTSA